MKVRLIFWLYALATLANLTAQVISYEELNRYTKPLLMPILLVYVYQSSLGKTTSRVLLLSLAIIFSWFGDVALMYQSSELYFLVGIGLFLIAQIIYVVVLRKSTYSTPKVTVVHLLPFFLYAAILFYILLPAGDFTIPIIIYGLVILTMMVIASLRRNLTSVKSFRYAFLGSVLFVLSDSILAINAFKMQIPNAGLFIMLTYCAAQYLLAYGILSHQE